jgi:hypothetical protein
MIGFRINLWRGKILMGKRSKNDDGRFWILSNANILKSLNHEDSHLTIC